MKRCPYCDEEIRDNAAKCKHCGSILNQTAASMDTLDRHVTIPGKGSSPRYDTLDKSITREKGPVVLGAQYRILKKLGKGGMGVVYLAEDTEMGNRPVAIKVLPDELADNVRAVENLRKEAITAINLNHPNIIRLHGFHADGDIKFLVMEYVDGRTLEEKLAESPEGKSSIEETVRIAPMVSKSFCHCAGGSLANCIYLCSLRISDRSKFAVLGPQNNNLAQHAQNPMHLEC